VVVPRPTFEEWKDAIWQEARARGVHVSVAVIALAGDVEALWRQEVEVIFRTSYRNIE
jgi:uncharacterized protein GlcG (DUF336 family)